MWTTTTTTIASQFWPHFLFLLLSRWGSCPCASQWAAHGSGSWAAAAGAGCHIGAPEGKAGARRHDRERRQWAGEENEAAGGGAAASHAAGAAAEPFGPRHTLQPHGPQSQQRPGWVSSRVCVCVRRCVRFTFLLIPVIFFVCVSRYTEGKQDLSVSISTNGAASINVSMEVNGTTYSGEWKWLFVERCHCRCKINLIVSIWAHMAIPLGQTVWLLNK